MYNFTFLITSGLNTEKKPNKWDELKTIASSNKIKFWSAAPPLTLNPDAPSPALVTPGNRIKDFIISASPKTTGICLIVEEVKLLTLIWGVFKFNFSILLSIIISSKFSEVSFRLKFFVVFCESEMLSKRVLYPK